MTPRRYHAVLTRGGYVLAYEENDGLADVPECSHMAPFITEAEAFAFAEQLEQPEPEDTP